MKKILSLFLALIMMLSLCMVLISCNNNDNSDSNDQNENNLSDNVSNDSNSPDELFNVDLAGYVANIGNATAIGISQKASSAVSPAAYGRAKSGSMLLLHSAPTPSQNNSESKNYIVMSTTDYDANTPETDENGLTKVSFTKIITENVTTETTGTRYVIANKGRIFISANEGFKYSVYYNDALVYNEIQDNDSNDKDDKIGIIVLDNLIEGVEYKVDYKGIGVTTTVTQDDIGGEIDKLYVLNGYTFISFVPQGQSERPSDSDLNYDSNGIAAYDKTGYSSGATRQSFVIDNATGYVYQIKDVGIDEIKNNLIVISGKIYDVRVNAENELEFYTVVQNETLIIYDYFKDKYGNKYICNNKLEIIDSENNTLYYRKDLDSKHSKYLFSKEGVVMVYDDEYLYDDEYSIKKMGKNFSLEDIEENESYFINDLCLIRDGYFYNTENFVRICLTDMKREIACEWIFSTYEVSYSFLDFNTIILYTENDFNFLGIESGCVYYHDVFGDRGYTDPQVITNRPSFNYAVILVADVESNNLTDNYESWLFEKATLTQTVYYKIIQGSDGKPLAVDETYTAPPQTVITLQPLNK